MRHGPAGLLAALGERGPVPSNLTACFENTGLRAGSDPVEDGSCMPCPSAPTRTPAGPGTFPRAVCMDVVS